MTLRTLWDITAPSLQANSNETTSNKQTQTHTKWKWGTQASSEGSKYWFILGLSNARCLFELYFGTNQSLLSNTAYVTEAWKVNKWMHLGWQGPLLRLPGLKPDPQRVTQLFKIFSHENGPTDPNSVFNLITSHLFVLHHTYSYYITLIPWHLFLLVLLSHFLPYYLILLVLFSQFYPYYLSLSAIIFKV